MSISPTSLALSWQYAPPAVASATLGPIVANGNVYCAVGTGVYAVKLATGEAIWAAPYVPPPPAGEATPLVTTTPAYLNGFVLVGSGDGAFHVLDAATGKSVQDIPCDGAVKSSPAVVGDTVYFGSDHGTVYAYQATPGGTGLKALWSRNVSPGDPVLGPVAILGDTIYGITAGGRAFELSRANGADVTPSNNLATSVAYGPIPTTTGVYVVSQNRLYNLMPIALRPQWVLPLGGDISAQPAFSNGVLYLVTQNGLLYAYDTAATAVRWSVSLGPASAPRTTPVIAGDTVILTGANGHVYALAAAGDGHGHARLLWTYVAIPTPGYEEQTKTGIPDIVAQPAVYGSDVVLVEGNGTLDDLNPKAYEGQGPTIDKMYPVGGPYPADPTPTVTARVRDIGSGLLTSSLQLFVDGKEIPRKATANSLEGYSFDSLTGMLTYTPRTDFSDGPHTVRILATNNRHIGSESPAWKFTITHRPINYGGGEQGGFGGPGFRGPSGGAPAAG